MPQLADSLDVDSLHLPSGGGARLDAEIRLDPVQIGGQRYTVGSGRVDARVDVSRTTTGYAFRLRFPAPLAGPCMRCLADARPVIDVDAREVDQPGESDELQSPYFSDGELDLAGWARDALVLALPPRLLCRDDCHGLCSVCGADLNEADPDGHRHESGADPRWQKLNELKFR
jgi:DUF177 domain-containing protein